jgi:hypothetical protein
MSPEIHLQTMYAIREYAMHYRCTLQKKDSKLQKEMAVSHLKSVSFKTERKLGITNQTNEEILYGQEYEVGIVFETKSSNKS